MNTRARLMEHFQTYPCLRAEDVFKYLYQSAFGCEHLAADFATVLAYIKREAESLQDSPLPQTEPLDGLYSRVHLGWLRHGLRPETLARLFCLSARTEEDGASALREKLAVARDLVANRDLPLEPSEFDRKLAQWAASGYPAIHHSEAFRAAYHPAYRVIANRYANFMDLFARIDGLQHPAVVTIEGGAASGKTTLAAALQDVYDCNVLHTDDFFLRPEQRVPERLAEVGGNLDRERFWEEIVQPLLCGETVRYRPFNCQTKSLEAPVSLPPKSLTVVEGSYAMHPAFGRYYDLAVFLDVPPALQRERILTRNSPAFAKRFFEEWIPMENAYFDQMAIRDRADLRYGRE